MFFDLWKRHSLKLYSVERDNYKLLEDILVESDMKPINDGFFSRDVASTGQLSLSVYSNEMLRFKINLEEFAG